MPPVPTLAPDKPQPMTSTPHTSPGKSQPFNKTKAVLPAVKVAPKTQQKNVTSRASKPFINWFQRKLAGTGRSKRTENHRTAEAIALSKSRGPTSLSSRVIPRITSSPLPSPTYATGRYHGRHDSLGVSQVRKTISLNDEDSSVEDGDDNSLDQFSLARESNWSPASVLEADDDASVRPIPPSAPPSPSPSRSSSSYLSDPRTFRSIAASTKPTTLLSIDMNGNGMAHIAQAPTTPPTYMNRFPHIRNSSSTTGNPGVYGSGTSITFSSLPQSSSRPSSIGNPGALTAAPQGHAAVNAVQAPLHTTHHPRNNPRPSSPPLDNASVLTLASSAYGLRPNMGHSTTPSARGLGDSLSHFGGSITYADAESTSQFVMGDDERLDERDVDASVRALRPRSSRRGSWESEASRWSARVQLGAGTPSLVRERSLRTTNSFKTEAFSSENPEAFEQSDESNKDDAEKDESSQLGQSPTTTAVTEASSSAMGSDSAIRPTPTDRDMTSHCDTEHKVPTETVEPSNSVSCQESKLDLKLRSGSPTNLSSKI